MQTSARTHRSKSSYDRKPDSQHHEHLTTELGQVIRAGAVAQRLGTSVQMVDQLRLSSRILAIPHQHGYMYPCWQFEGRGILSGLMQVLMTLKMYDSWSQLAFLITPNPHLVNQRPLDTLRHGEVEAVLIAAQRYAAQRSSVN